MTPTDSGVEPLYVVYKSQSQILKGNLLDAGDKIYDTGRFQTAAHHIVAWDDKRASQSRAILEKYNVDINASDNGVFLPNILDRKQPGAYHRTLHTNEYHRKVTDIVTKATDGNDLLDRLELIKTKLEKDDF